MSLPHVYPAGFTEEQLATLLRASEVQAAKEKIDASTEGTATVSFFMKLSSEIREVVNALFSLEITENDPIPFRWIKGDTLPHTDHGADSFEHTYLVYLTGDDSGQLILGETAYPITKGTAYVFQEGIFHETKGTQTNLPRLLMGPMNERGAAVGAPSLAGPGNTSVYLRQIEGTTEYSYDQTSWYSLYFPAYVYNTDESAGMFSVEWTTPCTFTSQYEYFICGSGHLQFGSRSLREEGTCPRMTVDGVTDYPGLIRNYEGSVGYSFVQVINLEVYAVNGAALSTNGAGWIGQSYFGTGATDNVIIGCHSTGDIPSYGGGILGMNAGSESGSSLRLVGCSSNGAIANQLLGVYAGGIVGANAATNGGSVTCQSCWSTGIIDGTHSGGIVGGGAGYNVGSVLIQDCYSEGLISGPSAGGIVGNLARNVTIQRAYTLGNVTGAYAGAIVGDGSDQCSVSNCYSMGTIGITDVIVTAGGIYGGNTATYTISNCYTTGSVANGTGYFFGGSTTIPPGCVSEAAQSSSGWNSSNATAVLIGVPSVDAIGNVWVRIGENLPYLLRAMGYTPYSQTNVTGTSLQTTYDMTLVAGQSSSEGLVTGVFYSLLKREGDLASLATITINDATGQITTTSATVPGIYTLYVYRQGSYHISTVTLTVIETLCGCRLPITVPNMEYERRYTLLSGNIMLTDSVRRRPLTYDEWIKMKMAKAFRA